MPVGAWFGQVVSCRGWKPPGGRRRRIYLAGKDNVLPSLFIVPGRQAERYTGVAARYVQLS